MGSVHIVGLGVQAVAIRGQSERVRVDCPEAGSVIHERLAAGGVAVGAQHGYVVSVIIAGDRVSGRIPLLRLLALANQAVSRGRVPVVAEGVADGSGSVGVLVKLLAVVGEIVEGVTAIRGGDPGG